MKRKTSLIVFILMFFVFINTSLANNNDIEPTSTIGYETYTERDFHIHSQNIKTSDIPSGILKTTIYYEWEETWKIDEYGNKLNLVSKTNPIATEATVTSLKMEKSYTAKILDHSLNKSLLRYNLQIESESSIYGDTTIEWYTHQVPITVYP